MSRPEVLVSLWNGRGGSAARRLWIEVLPHPVFGQWFQVRARAGHTPEDWWMRTNSVRVAIDKARQIVEHTAGNWREVTG